MRLHLGDSFRRTVGVFTGLEFAAALQDADRSTGPRQSRRSDRGAVTRADDDYLIVFFERFNG